jgi:hypothetical protein
MPPLAKPGEHRKKAFVQKGRWRRTIRPIGGQMDVRNVGETKRLCHNGFKLFPVGW